METVQFWTVTVLLAVCLSACAGLRAFLPLFLVGLGFRFGLGPLDDHAPGLAWLTSDLALWVLGVATVLEFLADKIPLLDNGVDAFGVVFRPIGGAAAVFAVLGAAEPKTAIMLSIFLAVLITLPIQAVKMGFRGVTNAASGGILAPLVSFIEDAVVIVGTILAFLAPIIGVLLLFGAVDYGGQRLLAFKRRRRSEAALAVEG